MFFTTIEIKIYKKKQKFKILKEKKKMDGSNMTYSW